MELPISVLRSRWLWLGELVVALNLSLPLKSQTPPYITDFTWGTQSVVDGCPASWGVNAQGTAPLEFQWYRDGQPLPGENAEWLIIPQTTISDSGSTFYVVVRNAYGIAESSVSRLEIRNDGVSLQLLRVESTMLPDEVQLSFFTGFCGGRPLDSASASDPANFEITGGLKVLSAELDVSGTNVILRTSRQRPRAIYSITVRNVADVLGNVVLPGMSATFEGPFSRGVFRRRYPHE